LLVNQPNGGQLLRMGGDGNNVSVLTNLNGVNVDQVVPVSGGPAATTVSVSQPRHAVSDAIGNVFVAVRRQVIRIDAVTGIATRVAGTGTTSGTTGDNLTATAALIDANWLAFDTQGRLYISESSRHQVRRLDLTTGILSIVAGTGTLGPVGEWRPCDGGATGQSTRDRGSQRLSLYRRRTGAVGYDPAGKSDQRRDHAAGVWVQPDSGPGFGDERGSGGR
jgi:hypothetical protein